ncbi:hypothetical protein HZB96_05060 [Candidatus Gottesmanbacteria bacterium]|nr:hypothetical protein [Candidatus Gottesmanbacteria bacterium]
MTQGCGNCNYQGKITEPTREGIKVYCPVDKQHHDTSFKCANWTPYLNNISSEARVEMAMDLRNSEEAKKAHQETIGINREANAIAESTKNAAWWALGISILSLIISAITLFIR